MSLACGRRGGNVPVNRSKCRRMAHDRSLRSPYRSHECQSALIESSWAARLVGLQQKVACEEKILSVPATDPK
jgi:hypothetical protein